MAQMVCSSCHKTGIYWKNLGGIGENTYCPHCGRINCHVMQEDSAQEDRIKERCVKCGGILEQQAEHPHDVYCTGDCKSVFDCHDLTKPKEDDFEKYVKAHQKTLEAIQNFCLKTCSSGYSRPAEEVVKDCKEKNCYLWQYRVKGE